MSTKDKPNNKNLRALFSVICLCIIALGLIVYFSTQSTNNTLVNEATTVKQTQTTEVQKRVTVKDTTTRKAATTEDNSTTAAPSQAVRKATCASSASPGFSSARWPPQDSFRE